MEVFFFSDTENCLRRRGQSLTPSLFFEIRAVARFKAEPEVGWEVEKRLKLSRDLFRERQAAREEKERLRQPADTLSALRPVMDKKDENN